MGRYTASNYGTLKIVFEMNLKLFQQECAKKLVIVLRDFDEDTDVKQTITDNIIKDIQLIWKEIKRPERFKDYTFDKFFEIEFVTLPHRFYLEKEFKEEVGQIRERLSGQSSRGLFAHVSKDKNVPSDALDHYYQNMWRDIINDKDLNIPGQKEMLARFKCNEVKDWALLDVEPEVESFIFDTTSQLIDDFKSRCEGIQKKAVQTYDNSAKQYMKLVYEEIRHNLLATLSQKLYICFVNQAKKLIPQFQKNMRQELEHELKNSNSILP